MPKNVALIFFALGAVLLLGLAWLKTGTPVPPSGPDSIWFHAGLLALLVGRFFVEYKFTKPNDVAVNALAVFVSVSTLSDPPLGEWWQIVRWGALGLLLAAIWLSWDARPPLAGTPSPFRSVIYGLVTGLGKAQVLFSVVFVLALISYFDLQTLHARIFAGAWGAILLASNISWADIASQMSRFTKPKREFLGPVCSFGTPSTVTFRLDRSRGGKPLKKSEIVGFLKSGASECHVAGVVVGHSFSANEVRTTVSLIGTSVDECDLDASSYAVTMNAHEIGLLATPTLPLGVSTEVVGIVSEGTSISRLKFEVVGSPLLSAGSLLQVPTDGGPAFFQIFDGLIAEEVTHEGSSRAFVTGEAEQVGFWSAQAKGFEAYDWVARERAAVCHAVGYAGQLELTPLETTVGTVPNSQFPVNVKLDSFILFHAAILGVTGSGKSYLTYSMIEASAAAGIKSVCLDPSGDYQRHLKGAVLLKSTGALKAFLDSKEHFVAILETSENTEHPITQSMNVAENCLAWCKGNRSDEEIVNPRPKLQIVLEEAHLLIPEFNFNPDQGLQRQVSRTSQVVLQARKYGLGFLVVSQRTANVVKSVLNQCNTIVSFQGFDETGFEFLKNYMGNHHVRSLPNLKARHAILVGKASCSRRPLMVKLTDQQRELQLSPAPEMQIPASSAPAH